MAPAARFPMGRKAAARDDFPAIAGITVIHVDGMDMMNSLEQANARAATTFNAAADIYDHAADAFWDRCGRCTVAWLGLKPGARVRDVCCGSGASGSTAMCSASMARSSRSRRSTKYCFMNDSFAPDLLFRETL